MTLRSQYSLLHSEFNDFLFAVVGEEENGMDLTVLFALTRLGLDPWREAVRFSQLTKRHAAAALAPMTGLLPEDDHPDAIAIAGRLAALLPRAMSLWSRDRRRRRSE